MGSDLHIELTVAAPQWTEAVPEVSTLIDRAIHKVWQRLAGDEKAEGSVLLSDDAAIQDLNRDHRGQDRATNVLAFPMGDVMSPTGPVHLGDIIIAYETVCREAERDRKTLEAHLAHMVVHGFLHLLGYDHVVEEAAREMEAIEVSVLSELGYADPYAEIADAAE